MSGSSVRQPHVSCDFETEQTPSLIIPIIEVADANQRIKYPKIFDLKSKSRSYTFHSRDVCGDKAGERCRITVELFEKNPLWEEHEEDDSSDLSSVELNSELPDFLTEQDKMRFGTNGSIGNSIFAKTGEKRPHLDENMTDETPPVKASFEKNVDPDNRVSENISVIEIFDLSDSESVSSYTPSSENELDMESKKVQDISMSDTNSAESKDEMKEERNTNRLKSSANPPLVSKPTLVTCVICSIQLANLDALTKHLDTHPRKRVLEFLRKTTSRKPGAGDEKLKFKTLPSGRALVSQNYLPSKNAFRPATYDQYPQKFRDRGS